MVIWLIGMSGAGKTCIGQEVATLLRARRPAVVFMDGDGVRDIMGHDLGHTLEDRRVNAARISRLCRFLDAQGVDVVCGVLSIFPDWQRWNREHIPEYFEVYLRVPVEVLQARDSKGLYRRALAGELKGVVGIDIEFPTPASPDLVIDNALPLESFEGIASTIVRRIPWIDDWHPASTES